MATAVLHASSVTASSRPHVVAVLASAIEARVTLPDGSAMEGADARELARELLDALALAGLTVGREVGG